MLDPSRTAAVRAWKQRYTVGLAAAAIVVAGERASAQSVPLRLWTNASHPAGLTLAFGYGAAVGDYDGDGFVDLLLPYWGELWRNVGGADWQLVRNVGSLFPTTSFRYSAAFADYDLDGRVDFALEPYFAAGDACVRLLRNLDNAGGFAEVAAQAIPQGSFCGLQSETIAWADVDADGWLDYVLPTYPSSRSGNLFFHSQGAVGPGGSVLFRERSAAVGLRTVWGVRPEGAEFVDVDRDGDLDFYTSAALYRGMSLPGQPMFEAVPPASSGIAATQLDEGAKFFDYDMDGDLDLALQLAQNRMTIFENRGDATFFEVGLGVFDQQSRANTGLSIEDWDNDGDLDLTNDDVLRRNDFVETGVRQLRVAPHTIATLAGTHATPCWLDWDRDGDMDCVLARWSGNVEFYENTLYGPSTPMDARRYVRVRPARDGGTDRGHETEFGARVEVVLRQPTENRHRMRVISSAGGYINQSEYAAHFGLPANVAFADLRFDVVVDFPSVQDLGMVRVDRWINPALGDIALASLQDREITVLRSGRVIRNGVVLPPVAGRTIAMRSPDTQPPMPTATTTLTAPVTVATDTWVGVAFANSAAVPMQLREIVVDGEFAAAVTTCGGASGNLLLLETHNGVPVSTVASLTVAPEPRNWRTFVAVDWQLLPRRSYAVVARMAAKRATARVAKPTELVVAGGLSFVAADPCAVTVLQPDPTTTWMWLRASSQQTGGFVDCGHGVAGTAGTPVLTGIGAPVANGQVTLHTASALPGALAYKIAGVTPACIPMFGGILVPSPDVVDGAFVVDANGNLGLTFTWPPWLENAYFQIAVLDPAAPFQVAASNALLVGAW